MLKQGIEKGEREEWFRHQFRQHTKSLLYRHQEASINPKVVLDGSVMEMFFSENSLK
jgi:hypothetical protein